MTLMTEIKKDISGSMLWYRRLGQLNQQDISSLVNMGTLKFCEVCTASKMHEVAVPKMTSYIQVWIYDIIIGCRCQDEVDKMRSLFSEQFEWDDRSALSWSLGRQWSLRTLSMGMQTSERISGHQRTTVEEGLP